MTPKVTTYKLDTAFAELRHFDHCAKPDDFIEADCLEDAEARACLMARGDEAIESVRQFART